MVFTHADDVTVALQRLEDQLQCRFAHVKAVALPDCGQDVQDVATFLSVCKQKNSKRNETAPACDSTGMNSWDPNMVFG